MSHAPTALEVQLLSPGAVAPSRAHASDAGLDLAAADDVELAPRGGRAVVGTGVAVAVPDGWVGLVCPRSGLAARHGVGVVNAPGVIDAGYRGELQVVLINHDPAATVRISAGDRIAQLLVMPAPTLAVSVVEELADGERASRGFGSSGMLSAATGDR
jgi:dUTP pyrophosphatase